MGGGAGARFMQLFWVCLDVRGRVLVSENGKADTIRVVEASLAPPAWMGPVEEQVAPQHDEEKAAMAKALADYGKLVEAEELADVVLVVEGERFPAHRAVLAARSEYFRGLFKSGMQEGGRREMAYEDVSAGAFRVLLRYLYTGEVPAGDEDAGEGWAGRAGGAGGCGNAGGVGGEGGGGKGKEAEAEAEAEPESRVEELLRVADRFQAAGLYAHCLGEFWRSLTAETAIDALVWAHRRGPQGAREVAMKYLVANCRAIQVWYPSASAPTNVRNAA